MTVLSWVTLLFIKLNVKSFKKIQDVYLQKQKFIIK